MTALRGSLKQIALLLGAGLLFIAALWGILWLVVDRASVEWTEAATIVQGAGTLVALFVGGGYAFYRLHLLRTFQPHLTIEHDVSHRTVGNNYVHVAVTAHLKNTSRVAIGLHYGTTILQQLSPNSDQTVEDLYRKGRVDEELNHFYWPFLEQVDQSYDRDAVVVEPGGSHPQTVEFVIANTVASIVIYTFYSNMKADDNQDRSKGWSATTVYDIL